ncbi:hypothetical protein FOMPIDRAFT_1054758 [Fomitopsis schrenkii]|uniref:Uncharacterized protein n=1 Tax=Fomitopsis schrenkii TaxID=2126942 RepID=S8DN71_FOMSC|nr:hypothetical protein FOMPIDRAFT_1054758 [Fomitopsis schrenkii]
MEQAIPSQLLQLSSIDLPGSKRCLSFPYAFSKQEPDLQKMTQKAPSLQPLDTLPRILVPSSRYAWRPPRMYYGWVAPQELLLDHAKKHKLLFPSKSREFLPRNLSRALKSMIRLDGVAEIGIDFLTIKRSPVQMKDGRLTIIVSVYTNYDLKRVDLPSDECIEKIGQCLGMEEPPKWYVDCERWFWEKR